MSILAQPVDDAQEPHTAMQMLSRNVIIAGMHAQSVDQPVPSVRGFVRSPFNPLIYHSVKQAVENADISHVYREPEKWGILLSSMFVDKNTEEETWKDLLQGKKLSPIMFPQSVPSSIIGYLASELKIYGPMTCMSACRNSAYLALRQAADWIEMGHAEVVILSFCDTPSLIAGQWLREHGSDSEFDGGVVSIVMESLPSAERRNPSVVISIASFLKWMQETAPYDSMAGVSRERGNPAI